MTPHIVKNEADAEAIKRTEAAKMSWCLCDVTTIYGEAGLRRRTDEWTDGEVPVIYPDSGPLPVSSQPAGRNDSRTRRPAGSPARAASQRRWRLRGTAGAAPLPTDTSGRRPSASEATAAVRDATTSAEFNRPAINRSRVRTEPRRHAGRIQPSTISRNRVRMEPSRRRRQGEFNRSTINRSSGRRAMRHSRPSTRRRSPTSRHVRAGAVGQLPATATTQRSDSARLLSAKSRRSR